MNKKELNELKLHVAGATVSHKSPFENLYLFKNDFELTENFIKRWVMPFYMNINDISEEWIRKLIDVKNEISPEIIQSNLGDFNWRTRQTGAFFSAITNQTQFIDIIGTHLLKSEVCYAGTVYCKVVAHFNSEKCVEYLNLYLDYYLIKPDLWFDQRSALEAIVYLDKVNSTNHFERHFDNWMKFLNNKPFWNKEISTVNLEKQLELIELVERF
jgi:hypothetical protein